jgi:hypothetical protein
VNAQWTRRSAPRKHNAPIYPVLGSHLGSKPGANNRFKDLVTRNVTKLDPLVLCALALAAYAKGTRRHPIGEPVKSEMRELRRRMVVL